MFDGFVVAKTFQTTKIHRDSVRYGLTRFVLVAKHPCGIGVDRSIHCAVKLHESGGRGRNAHFLKALYKILKQHIETETSKISNVRTDICQLFSETK